MKTSLIGGVQPLPLDAVLAKRIQALSLPADVGALEFRAAIEGPEGRVYRVLETHSLVEVTRMHEILRELGLRKAAGGRRDRGASYSALFKLPAQIASLPAP